MQMGHIQNLVETRPTPAPAQEHWHVEVDRVTRAEWSSMLDLFSDASIYQTWSYGAVRWGEANLSHLVLRKNGEVVGLAQLRIIRPTPFKFGMAYLRWGPLFHLRGTELDKETAFRIARALLDEYVSRRGLFLQVVANAFVGSNRAGVFEAAFSDFTVGGWFATPYRTFILDLSKPLDEIRRNLDKKWRNQLTRAEKNGLTVSAGSGIAGYQTFCKMYIEMRRRKAFKSSVSIEEFEQMQRDLAESHRMRVLICQQEGRPVAGLVASEMGDSAIYLLGATADGGLDAKGAYLLQWTLIRSLKNNGFKWYDLGGIDPQSNPGVYSFKKGLSGANFCQLPPFVACRSLFSSVVVNAGFAARVARRNLSAFTPSKLSKRLTTV